MFSAISFHFSANKRYPNTPLLLILLGFRITICWVHHTLWSSPPTVGTPIMSLLDTQEMNLLLLEIEYHESLEDFIKIKLKLKKKEKKKTSLEDKLLQFI